MFKKILSTCFLIFVFVATSHAQSLFTGKAEQKPLEVALAFLHKELPDGYAEGKQITTISQEPFFCKCEHEHGAQTKITFTVDGLADDSVKARKHVLILEQKPSQPWQVMKQDTTWACWQGRGHADFSDEPCV